LGENFVHQEMLESSARLVSKKAADSFRQMITSGCYRHRKEPVRVLACSAGDTKTASAVVALNEFGDVLDQLLLPYLITVGRVDEQGVPQKKREDRAKLAAFVSKNRPNISIVGASSEYAIDLKEEVEKVLSEQNTAPVPVEYILNDLGVIFMHSERSEMELKGSSPLARCAVSLGRRLLNPLAEFCYAFYVSPNTGKLDLLSLTLHPLQSLVPNDMMLQELGRLLLETVNKVGVELNSVVSRPFLAPQLNFVAGLGPLKARSLVTLIKTTNGVIFSREEIRKKMMDDVVFRNCAGFLNIRLQRHHRSRGDDDDDRDEDYGEGEEGGFPSNLLDGTRIHPEMYNDAHLVVTSALDEQTEDPARLAKLVRKICKPKSLPKLQELQLDRFARIREQSGLPKSLESLLLIKAELFHPFSDREMRGVYQAPSPHAIFFSLFGETDSTLYVGQMVMARVNGFHPFGLYCRLDSGIKAFVHYSELSDTAKTELKRDATVDERKAWMMRRVRIGDRVHARVKDIKDDRFTVDLTCRSSELQGGSNRFSLKKPDQYVQEMQTEEERRMEADERSKHLQKRFIPRSIKHPLFMNVSRAEAETLLMDRGVGDIIFRPSSKGVNFLTITWKVLDDVYFHEEIAEMQKPNPSTLGRVLRIRHKDYEDLDEVVHR